MKIVESKYWKEALRRSPADNQEGSPPTENQEGPPPVEHYPCLQLCVCTRTGLANMYLCTYEASLTAIQGLTSYALLGV